MDVASHATILTNHCALLHSKFRHFGNFKSIWQNFELTIANLFCFWANCNCCKWPNNKSNLVYWSHWLAVMAKKFCSIFSQKGGFFVEAGAYDGEALSNSLHFEANSVSCRYRWLAANFRFIVKICIPGKVDVTDHTFMGIFVPIGQNCCLM